MSRLGRRLGTLTLAVAVPLLAAGPSYAGGLQQCMDKAIDHNGEPPTCTKVNGQWVASWPDESTGSGLPGGFVFVAVIAVVVGLAVLFWKISTAQKLARQSGMDPALATQMTLLSDDGLEATYLASSLRGPATPAALSTPAAPSTSATARLEELNGLLDGGLVTQAEYDERRKAIIDSL